MKSPPPSHQNEKGRKRRRTPEAQRAEIERVAREHGADLSEADFDTALKKIARHTGRDSA